MNHKKGIYEKYIKRPQDFMCAALATVLLSPVIGATSLVVRRKLGSPVLFAQERPGLNGKVFRLYKFRSMTDERDANGNLLPDDVRLTSFGKKLRASSLDELPELFNILKGDMSVVGPRPLLVRYLPRYNQHQARRHEVRPGLTGLAQVHGRNAISWEEKFDWDVKYVDNISFLGDWKIILDTFRSVLKREGINATGEATMGEFMGSPPEALKRKKVLILSNNAPGLYSFRAELLEALTDEYEVVFCTPNEESTAKLEELGCRFIPCDVLERHGTNPLQELKLLRFYKRILLEEMPDMVFTYTIKPNAYGGMACAGLGIPYCANVTGLGTAIENGGIMQKLTLMLYRCGLRKAQKVFFQNTMNQDFMCSRKIVREEQHDLLPGSGVNLKKYSVQPYPVGETVDFLFISRIMREKGIDQYLEAAKSIRNKYPYTRFHICGYCEQDYKDRLRDLETQGIILYHGSISDVAGMHRICACTVHPSYYPEGMSNVLLESCACGRPIITTNRPGCGEIVDDGVNGFVVREKDSADLVDKIEKFLSLPWERRRDMGLAGRAKVEKEFDRQIVVHKYLDELAAVRSREERHAQTV